MKRVLDEAGLSNLGSGLQHYTGLSGLQCVALGLHADNGCACDDPGCLGAHTFFAARWHVVNGVFQQVIGKPRIALANGPLPPLGGRA